MPTIPISDGDPKNSYTATAGQTIFPYTFWVKDSAHIAVYVNGSLKTITTDYTVSAVLEPAGANIVFTSGLSADDKVVIVYDPALTRTAEYTGTIRLDALNTELTYLLTLLQSNQRKIDDAIRTSDTEVISFSGELPSLTGNEDKVLGLKADLSGLEYKTIAAGDVVYTDFDSETYNGNNSDTAFTMSFTPVTANQVLVWVEGVRQLPGTDYTVAGTTLTFTTAPPTGTGNIAVMNMAGNLAVTTVSDGAITTAKLADTNVTTGKIADTAITTGKLADDSVTLAKMEHATQGDVLYYGASGVPARLGAGTAGQVLQSGGAAANPSWLTLSSGVPVGCVTPYTANTPPTDWLECDGAAVSRTVYADLFAAIGTTFGAGDGATTFNLPDLRGEFIRGWDNSAGVDSGRVFGSSQADELKSHSHSYNTYSSFDKPSGDTSGSNWWRGTASATTSSYGGSETRPRNIALMYIIKY